jgi:hypothetical protein
MYVHKESRSPESQTPQASNTTCVTPYVQQIPKVSTDVLLASLVACQLKSTLCLILICPDEAFLKVAGELAGQLQLKHHLM